MTANIIRVNPALEEELRKIKLELSSKFKQRYKLDITTDNHVASQFAANKLRGRKQMNFKIIKQGLNRGKIQIL